MMSDSEEEQMEKQNVGVEEIPDSQSSVDAESMFPSSAQVELQSSCDTYMSQQSDEEMGDQEDRTVSREEAGATSEVVTANSSLEVEYNSSICNISTSLDKSDKKSSENEEVQEDSQGDIFQDNMELGSRTSPNEQAIRKRKERSDNSSPSPKKPRQEQASDDLSLSLKKPRQEQALDESSPSPKKSQQDQKSAFDSSDKNNSLGMDRGDKQAKEDDVMVIDISSTPEKSIVLDDSQEFSLRVEVSSPQHESQTIEEKPKLSQENEIECWKSHNKEKQNSPSSQTLSQKSVSSWSSHNNDLSWGSHKEEGDVDGDSKVLVETEMRLMINTIQWKIDEKTKKVLSVHIIETSYVDETQLEKPGRMSMQSTTSHKSSSSTGSVGLPGPFQLPGRNRCSIMSTVSSSTTSSDGSRPCWDGPFRKPVAPDSKTVVALTCGICNAVWPPTQNLSSPIVNGSSMLPEEDEQEELQVKPVITSKKPRKGSVRSQSSSSLSVVKETSNSEPQACSTPTPTRPKGRPRKNPLSTPTKITKNGVGRPPKARVASPVPSPPPARSGTPTPTKQRAKEAVLARWGDGRYYPGWVIVPSSATSQIMVKFCDGKNKLTASNKMVRADIITPGALVLVIADNDDDEYEETIVTQVIMDGNERKYMVERDKTTKTVPFSNIALTESQLTDLTMTEAQKVAASFNFNDLSLENILDHPRKRPVRTPLRTMTQGSPASSGRKKKRQTTPEPSTSHGKTFNGPDEYYMDTDSSTHSSCSLDLRGKEMKPLDIECSPPEVAHDSHQKLTAYRRNMTIKSKKKKGRTSEPDHLVKELGPIPEDGSQLFADCVFLITYTSEVELRKGLDARTSGFEDLSESERQQTPVMVWKDRLRTQIKSGGGKVYNSLNQVTKEELPNTFLVTDKPCNTPLFLLCLVSNIPIYSISLIAQCCTKKLPWKELIAQRGTKKLMAGYSLAKECLVSPRNNQPLNGKILLLSLPSLEPSLLDFWVSLIKKVGGTSEIYRGGCLEEQKFDIIVTEPGCDEDLVTQANEQNVPLVSLVWLQQCVINGEYRTPTEHPLYKYKHRSGADSPEY